MTIGISNMPQTPVTYWGKNFVNKIDLSKASKILDVGCRQGSITSYASSLYPNNHFTAIDSLNPANEISENNNHSNLCFEVGDIQSINYNNHFDAVISFSHLHWLKNKEAAIRNIYSSLKPGGKAYLQFFARHGRPKNDRFLSQVAQSFEWKSYFQKFSPHYYETSMGEFSFLLSNAGFFIHRMDFVEYKTPFEHPDLLRHWLGTWASETIYLPKQKHDHFLQETVHQYLNFNNLSAHDSVVYGEYLLEVICEKPESLEGNPRKRDAPNGWYQLTHREIHVLNHFLQGRTAKEIAIRLQISPKTVEFHLGNIKTKWNCYSRADIFQMAHKHGYGGLLFET